MDASQVRDRVDLSVCGISFGKINTLLVLCFLALAIVVGLLSWHQLSRGLHFNTDLRALLPQVTGQQLQQQAADSLLKLGGNNTVLMVAAEDVVALKQAAATIVKQLEIGRYWRVNNSAADGLQFQQFVAALQDYRFQLLSEEQKLQLQQGAFDQVAEQALYQLYQPSDWARIIPPANDPLNIFGNWLSGLSTGLADLTVEEGYLLTNSADSQGYRYGIVLAELQVDPFSLGTQQQALDEISDALLSLPEAVTTFRSGILFHAAEAATRAKREVGIIALGSVLGIVLLYLLSFRSLLPLGMSLCAIFFGLVAALAIVHTAFGEIHLITLVFGASLIGVAVDYALHFLSGLYHVQNSHSPAVQQVTPKQAIVGVFPGITLALLTTTISYLCLAQSAMQGLNQIALFSIVGLIAAWLFVIVSFPLVFRGQPINRYRRLAVFSSINVRLWRKFGKRGAIVVLLVIFPLIAVVGSVNLQFSRDIRTLHRPSLPLLNDALSVQKALNALAPNQFFIVSGDDPQRVLEAEEAFQETLKELISNGGITSFDKISNYLPSIASQHENYSLLKNNAYDHSPGIAGFMADLGVDGSNITGHLTDFYKAKNHVLSLSEWLSIAPDNLRSLWLEGEDGQVASVITLTGINNTIALRQAAEESKQIVFVDRVEDISQGLLEHSREAARLLLLAYVLIAALLLLRYRKASALLLVSVPLLSSVIVLALLGVTGTAISLFHIFGLFLVLGLGLDYGLFLREEVISTTFNQGKDFWLMQPGSSWIAINLSVITSCLSFGLMSFSSTPMVSAFGITVLIGSLCNLLLVPMVRVLASPVEVEYA